jgi:hypothetical protein
MADRTLGDLAQQVRSKNAGPFWLTLDVFFADDFDYDQAIDVLTTKAIADIYRVEPDRVRLYHLPNILVIKASFPRPSVQGGFGERDMHSGQQFVPLAALPVPAKQEA